MRMVLTALSIRPVYQRKNLLSIYLTGWQDIAFSPPRRVLSPDAWIHLVIHRGEYLELSRFRTVYFLLQRNLHIFLEMCSPCGNSIDSIDPSIYFEEKLSASRNYFILKYRSNLENTSFYIKLKIENYLRERR